VETPIRTPKSPLRQELPAPPWKSEPDGFRRREYGSYEEYKQHQAAKLARLESNKWIIDYEERFEPVLRERLKDDGIDWKGNSVLCLGARRGAEVRAFLSLGCFSIGVDLNPGDNNEFVLYGDFHKLAFADESVDAVYCNALDHVFDLKRVIGEIDRVVRPRGHVIIEIMKGSNEGRPKIDPYDCYHWETVDRVIAQFIAFGFVAMRRFDFTFPWYGDHILMIKRT
jgi:SAM-dependent methyltransferase